MKCAYDDDAVLSNMIWYIRQKLGSRLVGDETRVTSIHLVTVFLGL